MAQNLSYVLYGAEKARLESRPAPEIQDSHDVIIRISFVGVCGSDVHLWAHGGNRGEITDKTPLVMGHEASGVVHAVGPSVTTLKPGDRVALEPGFPCRRCKHCKSGRYNICRGMQFAAHPPTHGNLTRLFKLPEDFVYRIPDAVSLEEAVLLEPLSVAVHANRLAGTAPGQKVLVLGSRLIGLLVAAVARAFGAGNVCIADINSVKLEFAKGFVECATLAPDPDSAPEENAEKCKTVSGATEEFDVVLECTGVESSAQTGVYALRAGGVFVQVGMGRPLQALPRLTMCEMEVVLKGAFRYGSGDYELALELLASGKVSAKPLISNIVPFERATEAWEMSKKGEGIKNLIRGVQEDVEYHYAHNGHSWCHRKVPLKRWGT